MSDLSITAASVAPISGTTGGDTQYDEGFSGASVTAGQTVYKDTADSNKLKLADANGASPTFVVAGVALHAASAGQPLKYAKGGRYTAGATLTVGSVYVQSATPGGIAPVADLATGMYTTIIGIAETSAIMRLVLQTAGVAVP